MFLDVWFIFLTLSCIAWMSWVFVSHRRRVDPPLPPGPIGLPVVGSLPFLDTELHSYFTDLAKTYGSLFVLRLGKKIVVVANSPTTAKEILKDYDTTFANRDVSAAAKVASYGGGVDIGWSPYGPEWRMLRKVCVREMLGPSTLEAMYKLGKQEIEQTMQSLKERSTCAVNVGQEMFDTMMNVVMSMLWGSTIKGEEKAELVKDYRAAQAELMNLMGAPNISDFFPELERFDLQGIVKKAKVCAKKLDDIIVAVIDRRRKMDQNGNVCDEGGKDFIRVLLDLKDSEEDSKMPFTMIHLKALLADIVIAGTDTTSNTLEFAMAEIVNNPHVMKRAQQELAKVVGSISDPLEDSQIRQLPYLQAIMKETLRLHPVVPLLVPRCPTQSCIVKGYTVPKGSRVFVNVWAIHRDPSVWEDPLKFKPERWFLDGMPDFRGNDFSYLPFGSGRRICVGAAMAERMVMHSLASLLRYFDWKLPERVEKVDLAEKFGITLKLKMPLFLVPSPRSSGMNIKSES